VRQRNRPSIREVERQKDRLTEMKGQTDRGVKRQTDREIQRQRGTERDTRGDR
jgi:hypothetical protein